MKTKLCIGGFLLLFLLACEKPHYQTVSGNVKNIYTNENVPGICVGLLNACGDPFNCPDKLVAWAITDAQGNFEMQIEFGTYANGIMTLQLWPYDSADNMYRYMIMKQEYPKIESSQHQDLQLEPAGFIVMHVSDSIWNSINADTVIVQSPYLIKPVIRNVTEDNQAGFNVTPSQESTFTWFYIKNGIHSLPVTKNIFVPVYYKEPYTSPSWRGTLEYEINF
jgi:hypothetical protein